MTTKKPRGSYSLELAAAIREYHAPLLTKDGSRRKRRGDPESAPITQEMLAACAQIDKSTFSKFLSGKGALALEPLFRLISMPWVSREAAQRWIFLWMANQIDAYTVQEPDEEVFFLSAMKSPTWHPNRNLDRLGDSLMKLAEYGSTLGVIDQIDHARRRCRDATRDHAYRLPMEGPRIWRDDLDTPVVPNSLAEVLQHHKRKQPLTALTVKFAQELADREAEERVAEVNGYVNEEVDERLPVLAPEIAPPDSNVEVERDAVLENLGVEAAVRVMAAEAADVIIMLAKTGPGDPP